MFDWNQFQEGSAPFDAETAQKWLDQVSEACATLNADVIVDAFNDDIEADLGPTITSGKEQLGPVISQRYAKSKYSYFKLKKTLKVLAGDVIVCDARLDWKAPEQPDVLQHTRAIEILTVRDGRVSRWENAVITWPETSV